MCFSHKTSIFNYGKPYAFQDLINIDNSVKCTIQESFKIIKLIKMNNKSMIHEVKFSNIPANLSGNIQ